MLEDSPGGASCEYALPIAGKVLRVIAWFAFAAPAFWKTPIQSRLNDENVFVVLEK